MYLTIKSVHKLLGLTVAASVPNPSIPNKIFGSGSYDWNKDREL